jgi:predicted ATPase
VQALFFCRWCNRDATLDALDSAEEALLADAASLSERLDAITPWCNQTAYPVGAVTFEGTKWPRRAFATAGLKHAAPLLVEAIKRGGGSTYRATMAVNELLQMDNDFPIFCAVADLAWYRPDLVDPASPVHSGIGAAPFMDVLQLHLGCASHDEVASRIIALQPTLWPEAKRGFHPIDVEYLACECRKYYSYVLGTKTFEGKNKFTPGVSPTLMVDVARAVAAATEAASRHDGATSICVVAGGPCSGKSTLCAALRDAGYAASPEVAETLINDGLAKGLTVEAIRGDEVAWQTTNIEANFDKIEALAAANADGGPVFSDTSFLETAVFADRAGISLGPGLEAWLRALRYRVVFLLEPLAFEQTAVRLENASIALSISEAVAARYAMYGYEVVRVPPLPIEARLAFVLERVHGLRAS